MQEIELKILEIDEQAIRMKLDAFAKRVREEILMTTITFSNPYNAAALRLRRVGKETIFTVKVPVPDNQFKIREEYETHVKDFEGFRRQLVVLGFSPVMLQEKKRTTYRYGQSEIVIDRYPKIPPYIEVEGDKREIKEIVAKLGYSMEDTTDQSVYELFELYGVDGDHLVF